MSFEYYMNWWIKGKKDLENLLAQDELIRKKFKPINDRNLANNLIGGMYAKYSLLVQDLCACVDQMAHPQKRFTVKKLVDSACIRLNEFNEELRKISLSEYHCIDGTLVELKLIPYDVEILHPSLFHHRPIDVEDFLQRIRNGDRIYDAPKPTVEISPSSLGLASKSQFENVNEEDRKVEEEDNTEVKEEEIKKKPKRRVTIATKKSEVNLISPEEIEKKCKEEEFKNAVICLQTAERARQNRIYFSEKNIRILRSKAMRETAIKKTVKTTAPDAELTNLNVIKMQKIWRGYRDREYLKFCESKRRLLIGMTEPSWRSTKEFEIFEANLNKRRIYRDQRIREYIQALDQEKVRILRVVAPGLLEDVEDEIREWFHQWYVGARTFDKYPPEEKGGTILVVRGETMTPQEYLDEYERKRREKVKAGGAAALKAKADKEKKAKLEAEKKKKELEKKLKEAEKKKKKKKKPGEFDLEYGETLSKTIKESGDEEFTKIWNERSDFDNPEERHYVDLITEKFCYETQLEVRKQADELMRLELELLQESLAKDKGKKYKPKKEKKKKKKGKKSKKDLTADRMLEDLIQELVDNKIIHNYNTKVKLEDFLGDFSYKNTELRSQDFDPAAAILETRQAITLNCIQPLGVETMKKLRSVLIVGPRQCGLHLLANAIFNHTQCVLFDLSAEILAGLYPGSKGLTMLIHLITKVSKLIQPSIIYINKAERLFYKKVPKDEKDLDPKRLGKKLFKGIVKVLKPEDRVLVLGVTNFPWLAQAKLNKTFERIILIPRPDYGSVYLWWRELLRPYHGLNPNFNFTSLAKATVYQPYSVIKEVVEKVLTPRRIIQLKYNPLKPQELFENFVANQLEPIADKEWKKYEKWYKKTPLGKERGIFNKWADNKREIERKQQEKEQNRK